MNERGRRFGPFRVSSTRERLSLLRGSLLALTVLAFLACDGAYRHVHDTAELVHERSASAILEVSAAREALIRANSAAMRNFATGAHALDGPGQVFQSQLALASQSLAQVARDNVADDGESGRLRLVAELVSSYSCLIGQADVHYRVDDQRLLGAAELWDAWRLLDESVVAELDELLRAEQRALDEQVSGGSDPAVTLLPWVISLSLLVLVLVVAQVYLARRFRRRFSFWLLAATVLPVLLAWVMLVALDTQQRLDDARASLRDVVAQWESESARVMEIGRTAIEKIKDACEPGGACARSVLDEDEIERGAIIERIGSSDVTDLSQEVLRQTETASDQGRRGWLILLLSTGIALLVVLGFRARFDEYRYRSR